MNQSVNRTVLMNGQEQVSSQTPTVLSYPTIIPGLDLNFVWAISVIYTAGAIIFISFAGARICQWITLRRPIPIKLDDKGEAILYRSKTNTILGWPRLITSKLALRSFHRIGIPSLGTILLIICWIGITGFASIWLVRPTLSLEGIAYRIP